jgi:polar amino acid transport system permease protein
VYYQFNFGVLWEYRWALAEGLATTLLLSLVCIVTGSCLAIPWAIALRSQSVVIRGLANVVVQTTRAVPVLVLLVGAYYVVPTFVGLRPPALATAWGVLSVYLAAFVADAIRAAALSVPRAYRESGLAIGMSSAQVRWYIVTPEVIRRALPALTALYIGLFKYSTLASVISVKELLHAADLISVQRLRPLEAYVAVAALFILIVVPAGLLARRVEHWLNMEADVGGEAL